MGGVSPLDATILYIYLNLLKWISQLALGDCITICSNGRKWSVINVNKCQISRICHLVARGADRYSGTVHCPSSVKLCWECAVLAGIISLLQSGICGLQTPSSSHLQPASCQQPRLGWSGVIYANTITLRIQHDNNNDCSLFLTPGIFSRLTTAAQLSFSRWPRTYQRSDSRQAEAMFWWIKHVGDISN